MKSTDILMLQFEPFGRDPEATYPLLWYLEHVFKYHVSCGSMIDSRYLIDTLRPKALLLNNLGGNEFTVLASTYAYNHGIKVFSLISEGLYYAYERNPKYLFWGNFKDHTVCWHKMFFWSNSFLQKMSKNFPELSDTFDVSGATTIDRLLMYSFMTKREFLKRHNKPHYKKIVTYFGYVFSTYFDKKNCVKSDISEGLAAQFRTDYKKTKKILHDLIRANKDILFVLKRHPTEDSIHLEVDSDWCDENIVILKDQESVADLVNMSDIVFVYDSTVSYEAYTLHKPVVNIAPNPMITYKNDSYMGNAHAHTIRQAQSCIDEYYRTGKIKDFDKRRNERMTVIRKDIHAIDGLNSWRTANKISSFLRNSTFDRQTKFSLSGYLLHLSLWVNRALLWVPRLRDSVILPRYNDFHVFYDFKRKYDPQIKRHYQRFIKKMRPEKTDHV